MAPCIEYGQITARKNCDYEGSFRDLFSYIYSYNIIRSELENNQSHQSHVVFLKMCSYNPAQMIYPDFPLLTLFLPQLRSTSLHVLMNVWDIVLKVKSKVMPPCCTETMWLEVEFQSSILQVISRYKG